MAKNIKILLLLVCIFGLTSNGKAEKYHHKSSTNNLIQYVNPFVGTKNMGHTFPGASTPFGMVQLSPETNFQPMYNQDGSYNQETYRYCSGYQYDDSTIFGFSHTHF
ncbi:MAG: hypothetical protein JW755_02835, partial [Candidatus Aminicenantes bacterium]|nr:hypothetical protein [Candidatus Aminicenantes bacterium]